MSSQCPQTLSNLERDNARFTRPVTDHGAMAQAQSTAVGSSGDALRRKRVPLRLIPSNNNNP